MKRKQLVARKVAPRKSAHSGDEIVQRSRGGAIAFLHATLGNREVARLLGGRSQSASPQGAPNGLPAIQRGAADEQARMKEAFRRGGITEEMIRGERTDGFIDYDEETGTARWIQIEEFRGPEPEPKSRDEMARMKAAFKRAGITEDMVRGDRTDGFIDYDEETGTAKWIQVEEFLGPGSEPESRDEMARMKAAFKRGGITDEMVRGERLDGFIDYNEETGVAQWVQIEEFRPAPKPRGTKKAGTRKK